MGYNTGQLVDRGSVRPNWLADERFWYRAMTAQGSEFILVNPANGRAPASLRPRQAGSGAFERGRREIRSRAASVFTFTFSPDGNSISFSAAKKSWKCDIQAYTCAAEASAPIGNNQRGFNEIRLARRKAVGVYPRLEFVGARYGER